MARPKDQAPDLRAAAAGAICTQTISSRTATVTIGRLSQPGPPQGHFRLAFAALNFMTLS
jgi:hypothetical protein